MSLYDELLAMMPTVLLQEHREDFARRIYRLRSARQSLIFAECPPQWWPRMELVIALGLLPLRSLAWTAPGHPDWERLLLPPPGDDGKVWTVRGTIGDGFYTAMNGLNFHREDAVRAGRRVWVWLQPGELPRASDTAPDLWRFRDATLTLKIPMVFQVDLPDPEDPTT